MYWSLVIVLLVGYFIGSTRGRTRLRMRSHGLQTERANHKQTRAVVAQLTQSNAELQFTNRVLVDEINELVAENKQLLEGLSQLSDTLQTLNAQHERTLAALN